MRATIGWGSSSLRAVTSSLRRCALVLAALAMAAAARAEGASGPFPAASLQAMRAARLAGTAFAPLEDRSPESSGPERWRGYDGLAERVKRNLAGPTSAFQVPAFGANVRANDPTGDLTNEGQNYTVISAWGRFVVVAWLDTKGRDVPVAAPPNTYGGYAWSCDWGQTFTDAGNLPHPKTNEQLYTPSLANDGRGRFYMVATCDTLLDGSGVPQVTALAFWEGTFDTTTCTLAWGPRQMLDPMAATAGTYPDFPRVVADPYDDYVYIIYTQFAPTRQDVRYIASPDGGQTWSSPMTLSNASTTWSLYPDLAVGPDHELYACWGEYSWYYWCDFSTPFSPPGPYQWVKSTNRGATWTGPATLAARYSNYTSNGPMDRFGWTKDFPRMAVDRSSGPGRGNVYAVFGGSAVRSPATGTGATVAELEPNAVPAGAGTLNLGDDATGTSSATNDRDLWKVYLTAGQVLTARVEPQGYLCGSTETSYGYVMRLYPEFANPAAFATDSMLQAHYHTTSIASITFSCKVSGWYYLDVFPQNIVAGISYVLRTRSTSFTQVAGSGRDEEDILFTRSTNGGASWSSPVVVNADVPPGYQETGWNVNVDASGRVRVVWHDHRETEATPPISLRGQLSDLYMAESSTQGASFGPGVRVSDESSLFGPAMRVTFVQVGHHGDLQSDGDHLFFGWDDQRLSTRTTTGVDAMTVFVDKEAPRTAWVAAPANASFLTSAAAGFTWSVDDRRERFTGNTSSWELRDPVNNALLAGGAWSADSAKSLAAAELDIRGDGPYRFDVYARDAGQNAAPAMSRGFLLDRTAPSVTITNGPAPGEWLNSASAAFDWTASDLTPGWNGVPGSAGVQVSYRLDGGTWSAWGSTSGASYVNLAPGPHQFDLRARDAAGNETAQSCSFNSTGLVGWWPAEGSAGDSWGTNGGVLLNGAGFAAGRRGQAFAFDGVDDYATVPDNPSLDPGAGSFTVEAWLRTTAAGSQRIAVSKYEPGGLNPPNTLATYLLAVSPTGAATFFARDDDGGGPVSQGQELVGATINDGGWHHVAGVRNVPSGTLELYVDGALSLSQPIGAGASGSIGDEDADPDPLLLGAIFQPGTSTAFENFSGQIDEVAYSARALPASEIASIFASGGRAPCAAGDSRQFTVDTQAPETAFFTAPAEGSTVTSSSVELSWQGTDDLAAPGQLGFRSRFDGGAWSPFGESASTTLASLAEGPHVFEVAARDLAGNEDATPATRTWTVHAQAPVVTFLTAPPEGGYVQSPPVFTWTSALSPAANRAATTYEYDLDGSDFTPVGPDTSLALGAVFFDGPHTLTVRVTDDAGLQGTATRNWTQDATGPEVSFTRGPAEGGTSLLDGVVFGWFGTDAVAPASQLTYRWSLDGAAFGAPSPDTTLTLNGLSAGSHTFAVRAYDPAGNASLEMTRTWNATLPALAGTYTIGASGDYSTFAAAVSALTSQGVSGPVTFDVLDGSYTEHVVIPAISGASATNRVTFRSQSGNPADVQVQFAAVTGFEGVVDLAGASYVTISAMSLSHHPASVGGAVVQFTGPGNGNQLIGCVLPSSGASSFGIHIIGNHTALEVRGNRIDGGGSGGLYVEAGYLDGVKILANRFENATLYAVYWTGPATGALLVANNFLSNSSMEFWAGPGTGGVEVAYNSVWSSSSFGLALFASGSGATPNSFAIVNNILSATTGGIYAYMVDDASVVATSDHNDLHAGPGALLAGWNGSILTTLSQLQAASGKDLNSVSVDPGFVSATDLHTTAPLLNGAGTPLATVTTDIDGEPRNATAPDIGADEYTPLVPALAGAYTIGAGQDFDDFPAAVAALTAQGVSGPVAFDVVPGTYTQRPVFSGPIPGASPANRVTFRSQTGNAADVAIEWTTESSSVGVVHLESVNHVTFSNLTIRQLGAAGGSAVRFAGTTVGNRVIDCVFEGNGAGTAGFHLAAGTTAESLEVRGNRVTQFETGLYAEPATLAGARVLGNTFSGISGQAIRFDEWTGPASGAVLVANNFLVGAGLSVFQRDNSNGLEIVHNTIRVSGTVTALDLDESDAPIGSVRIRNNVLACAGDGLALRVETPAVVAQSDHNDLFGMGNALVSWGGTNHGTLASLQAASGMDANSVSFDPGFVSATDLHTALAGLADRGSPVASVTTDIDGEPRSGTAPDIGADEYTTTLAPLAGTFSIGGGGTHATFAEAVETLGRHGVSGPVAFDVSPGSYPGQVAIGAIAGASPANHVTFRSASGIPTDVTIQHAAIDGRGVLELVRADHVTVSAMTLEHTAGLSGGTGVVVGGGSRGARVLGCLFTGLGSSGDGLSFSLAAIVDSFEFRGNSILQSSRGVHANSPVMTGVRITGNRIENSETGISLDYLTGPATGSVLIANNFIVDSPIYLRQVPASEGIEIHHNSVNMPGSQSALVALVSGAPPANSVRMQNNIFACPGGAQAVNVSSPAVIAVSDHNDFHTTGANLVRWGGVNYGTLAALQAASGKDANSLSTIPGFLSATDLHTTFAALDGSGAPIASVTDDFDGDARSATAPDIGADEFTALPALAGTYTIGTGGSYATIAAALADLTNKGVIAAVTFDLLPGTYAGQVVISPVPGASATNTVTFRSQSGSAADVTLQFATASQSQGVVELAGASHVRLSALTIQVTNAAGNGVGVRLTGASVGARIQNCVFTGLGVNGYGVHAANATCEDLEVRENTIAQSSYGVTLSGSTLTGVRILRNTIGTAGTYGINVSSWAGPATNSILLANNVLQNARIALIQSAQSQGAEVFHNTIAYAGTSTALVLSVSGTVPANAIQVVNNVVSCNGGGVPYGVITAASVGQSDHNAFFTTGTILASWVGTNRASLAELQAASGKDLASLELYPGFLDATLHTRLSMLDGGGAPLASVATDYDGEPRSATAPDIGADEFTNPSAPLAGSFTVGSGGDYGTLAAAASDLLARGVSGPVTFNLLSQTFAEQLALYTPAGASPANRVTFRSQTGNASDVTLAYNSGPTASGIILLGGADHVTISDLSLQITHATGLGYGVLFNGGSVGVKLLRCVFGGMQTTGYGVYFASSGRADTVEIRGNTIGQSNRGIFSTNTTMTGVRIVGNSIRDASQQGIYVESWAGPATGAFLLANNMLANAVLRLGVFNSSAGADVFHNTVYVTGTADAFTQPNSGSLPANVIRLRNNIFACPGGGRAMVSNHVACIAESDQNDLYTAGQVLSAVGAVYATLAEHQAGTGKDLNSVSFHPGVVSASDLHTTLAALDGRAAAFASVTDDIDGDARDASTPDIGADEFTAVPALAGDYTIGAGGAYATFAAANADLLRKGVSAPVTFRVLNGTYNERLLLETPGGSSSANRVDFRSESANPADVTLRFATSGLTQGVVEWLSADWISLTDLTVRVTNASGLGTGFRLTGATSGARVRGCSVRGLQGNGYGVHATSGIADSLEISSCVVDSGGRGISLESPLTLRGVQVLRNRVASTVASSVYLSGWSGPATGAVLFANNSFASLVQIRTNSVTSVGAEFHHNSVSITVGTNDALSMMVGSGTLPTNALRLKNNALAAFTGGRALSLATPAFLAESDHNDLFTSGVTTVLGGSTAYARLADWQATGWDLNSISVHPGYLNVSNDLHSSNAYLDGRGTPIAAVTDDIDGQPRSATAPDIGADESTPLSPLAGTYTVGSGGDYAAPTAAINDLYQRGVSGPVSLDLLAGTYNGQWLLQTPAGASPANRVTIRSQSGNAADVTLAATLAGNTQGVVELRGADHLTVSALTLQPGANGSGVLVIGRTTGARIERCRVMGLGSTGGVGIHLLTNAVEAESLEVRGNVVPAGVVGVYVNTGAVVTGVKIVGNTLNATGSTAGPFAAQGWVGPATGALLVANNFLTGNGRVVFNQTSTASQGAEFCFNSVSMASTQAALYLGVTSGTPAAGSLRIRNNVLANSGSGQAYQVVNAAAVGESDYNDLYKSAGGVLATWAGSGYATLANLQAASGKDAHSVSGNPVFTSATDLHTSAALLAGAATPIAYVPDDFDGELRSATAPDIGADELVGASDLTPPVVAFVAGPADGAVLFADTTSYAWSGTDDTTPTPSLTYRTALDAAFSGAYSAATTRSLAGLADGDHVFSVEARDGSGNVSTPVTRQFRVRAVAPDLAFDSPASGAFTGPNVTVAWHLSAHSSAFNPDSIYYEHRLDGGPYSVPARDSSLALAGLPEGPHAVDVRVTDDAGRSNTRSRAFTVDVTPPVASIASGPPENGYSTPSVGFTFAATDNLTPVGQLRFSRRLDGGAFTTPATGTTAIFADLGPGPHTLTVRAFDAADNVSADVTRQWTVDASPPETQITGGPADGGTLGTSSATFDFTGSDNLTPLVTLRFQARLDAAAFDAAATTTSRAFSGMSDGPHTFEVRAVDLAGLVDATPDARSFTVDAQGPAITIASGPANNACLAATGVAFAWSATDAVTPPAQIEFSYQLDAAPFTPYGPATDASFTTLAEGLHTFTLQARDGSGHVTSVSRTFRVDVSAPVAAAPTTRVLDSSKIRVQCTATDNSGVTGFRVQVSTDPAFGSVAADVQIGSGGTYDYIGVPGSSYYARAQASDCAGNQSAFTEPSNVAILASLPNLLVTSVTAPPAATSGQAIVVDYTVANNGAGPTSTPSWTERAYLSPAAVYDGATAVLLGSRQNVTYLGVGESYSGSITGTVPVGTSGARWVHVVADAGNLVPETDGADNTTASSPVAVALGAIADLVVTQVVSPPTALSSETIPVSWTVRNDGDGRTDATQWWDTIFLSEDAVFDFTVLGGGNIRVLDLPIARFQRTGALEADSAYSRTEQVTLPAYFGGTRHLFVASDLFATQVDQAVSERGAVFEDQHELNATAAEAIEVTQQLPPDLTVDGVSTFGPAFSGGGLQVTFTVGNHGFNATGSGSWTDQLYLSADAVLDGGDVLLGSFPHSGNVELDGTYAQAVNVTIPKGTSGPRWLIAKTDAYAQLVEYLENNNVVAGAQAVTVTLSPWANLEPVAVSVSDTVLAGGSGSAQWQVTNGGTAAMSASLSDNIELGTGPAWSAAARVSGSKRASRALQPGESYSASTTFDVPASYAGTYYAFARTDAQNEVFEHTDEGDNVTLLGAVYVKPYPAIDLAVSNITAPASATGGAPLAVTYTVTNSGAGATLANWWAEEVWLSADQAFNAAQDVQVASPGHAGALASGAGYTKTANGNVPQGLNGTFHVIVRSDPGGGSGDGALANNTVASAGTVVVTSPAPPQLMVSGVTVAANLDAGQPAQVSWQVHNTGAGAVPNAEWYVGVYLSQDPWLDGSDVSLGSVPGPAGFAGGASAAQQLTPAMPVWASGAYYVIVRADNRNEVWESGGENDNTATAPTVLTLPPPSDLVVTDIVVPPAAVPGEPILVSYTLSNQGANPAVGQLQNAVYMSSDAAFVSDDDPLVGIEVVSINLPPGTAQRFTQRLSARPLQVDLQGNVTALLPALSPGAYHAIVKANIRDNIRESDGSNNQTVSAAQVQTDLPALVLGIPAAFNLANGQARFWKVTVPADFDLRLTLASDVADATNEMFVAFGRTPDANEYDFSGPAEFTADPMALVPQTQAGTYYVMVIARGLGQVASLEHVTLLAETLPFSIASHSPGAGGAGGRVTVRVRGAGLRDTTEIRLEQSGIVRARARLARFTNSTDLLARFDLAGVTEGPYDLVAANGLTTVVVPAGFTVEPPRPIDVAIETDNADVLRRSATAPFTVRLRNPSNQDAPVVRARILFPATSKLRTLETGAGLFRASQLVPSLAPVAGDAVVLHRAGGGDSLLAVDVMGANLAPGEVRSLTLGVSGFESSPYSLRVLADAMTLREFLDRQQAGHEAARRALLAAPEGLAPEQAALAGDAFAFRDEALLRTYVDTGALAASDVDNYLFEIARLVPPSPTHYGLPAGPQALLDELATGGPCGGAGVVPECAPDVAVPGSALPACATVFETGDLPVPVATAGGRIVRTQGSTAAGFTSTASANTRVVVPCDPNLMTGPAGFGTEKWVRGAAQMPYRVDFENLPGVASAPAQVVRITVPIDPNLDLTTFRVGSMGFGGVYQVNVPAGRTSYSSQTFYSDLGLSVRVTAGINLATREASWVFTTLDPATGQQPVNPLVGFLPVNDTFGRGTGFATYTIQPYANAFSGSTVQAQASIQFDVNTPVPTNSASNRVDTRQPTSLAINPIAQLDPSRVRVSWNGTDDSTGAGLANVTLYMRQDAGAFTPVAPPTGGSSLEVPVTQGHTFGFYTLAADNVGNAEASKATPEAAVTLGTPQLGVEGGLPRVTQLHQNYPNPFRGGTKVRFDLARPETVTLDVYDVQGRLVSKPLDAKKLEAGSHVIDVSRLPRGASVYFYRLRAGSYEKTRRMVLIP